jgi:SAM-dependent methyltransferase
MRRCLNCEARFALDSWECPQCRFAPATDGGIPVFAPELARAVAGYESALFDAHGGEQAERSFWTSARAALIIWALGKYAPGATRFLEVGCGTGGVLARLESAFPQTALTGAEALVPGLHAAARRLTRTNLMQFDATRIPFDAEFDAIGAFDVIEHIRDDDRVIASMAAALAPGGVLLITVPQHPFLFGPADVSAKHERRYTAAGLSAQVMRAGLTLECVTSFVSLLFPAMATVRLIAKARGGDYDSADEFRIGPLNGVFARVMDVERWAIGHGARFPFGGSLLVVGRKAAA